MKKSAKIALIIIILMSAKENIFAQWPYKVFIGGGLSTVQFNSDNRSTVDYFQTKTEQKPLEWGGGSLDMSQAGVDLRGEMEIDSMGRHIVPFGLDITFLNARERTSNDGIDLKLKYNTTLLGFYLGYDYSVFIIPKANARIYVGGELRGNFITGSSVQYTTTRFQSIGPDSVEVKTGDGKKDAFRLGGYLRLGVIGKLKKDLEINASIAYGALNLFGRDDNRGELLTFVKDGGLIHETKENILKAFNVSIVLQYRIK